MTLQQHNVLRRHVSCKQLTTDNATNSPKHWNSSTGYFRVQDELRTVCVLTDFLRMLICAVILNHLCRAMAEVVSHRRLVVKARCHSQASRCEICGWQWRSTAFSLNTGFHLSASFRQMPRKQYNISAGSVVKKTPLPSLSTSAIGKIFLENLIVAKLLRNPNAYYRVSKSVQYIRDISQMKEKHNRTSYEQFL